MIRRLLNSIGVKVGIIGILMLILLIPASMVTSLIKERRDRKVEAVNEISGKWGKNQVIAGPIITVPYRKSCTDKKGKSYTVIEHLNMLPEELNISGELVPEIRYRGIYKTVLYVANLKISGSFKPQRRKINQLIPDPKSIEWDKAMITIGISDMTGIREGISLKLNEREVELEPGSAVPSVTNCGVRGRIDLSKDFQDENFSINISLNGSHDISFLPLGKTTVVKLTSQWASPSFTGRYLPVERKVSDSGFSALWRVFEFKREYPQVWVNKNTTAGISAFGVKLFIGNDIYNQAIRTVKYAVLFILFTFVSIFLSEIISKSKVHPLQYLLIGSAVTIFYVLLISISEHLSFGIAYMISSTAVVCLIFTYIRCIFNKLIMPIVIAVIQILLYLYFYITLQSEDYALLMGSLGLFALLATVMYVTRKINWDSKEI